MPKRTITPAAERFWPKVNKDGPNGCWVWTAALAQGYGRFGSGLRRPKGSKIILLAHRWSYEALVGPIPDGMGLDHICHNRACVNPDHLRVATQKQNCENTSARSGYRGVSWAKNSSKWVVFVKHQGRNMNLGYFVDIEEANRVAIAARNKLYTHNDLDRIAG